MRIGCPTITEMDKMFILYLCLIKKAVSVFSHIRNTLLPMFLTTPSFLKRLSPSRSILLQISHKYLSSFLILAWWMSIYIFCSHPNLINSTFLLSSLITIIINFNEKTLIRKSLPSLFSCLAYGALLVSDTIHYSANYHSVHLVGHGLLFLCAGYTFISIDPHFVKCKCNHSRILCFEILAHSTMSLLEPSYFILVGYNGLELIEKNDSRK